MCNRKAQQFWLSCKASTNSFDEFKFVYKLPKIIIPINFFKCSHFSLEMCFSIKKRIRKGSACVLPQALHHTPHRSIKDWSFERMESKWKCSRMELTDYAKLDYKTWSWTLNVEAKARMEAKRIINEVRKNNLLSSSFNSHGNEFLLLSSIIPPSKCATCFVFMIFPLSALRWIRIAPFLSFAFRSLHFYSIDERFVERTERKLANEYSSGQWLPHS